MSLIWASRGRSWGFRFLRTAGLSDPLSVYETEFSGIEDMPQVWRRDGDTVALRLPDPHGRCDQSGRVIRHDFVVFGSLASKVNSIEDGTREVWPRVADRFDEVWDKAELPSVDG
ncbi:hypothetical protein [Cryobacterium sp. TMS1-13-1]|uniref:hypothetical protein n=1 Tax=Cryobacterium sp. TMS1-13-1 TaxID=1259220 RepID=UPI00106A3F14|nr:hypothetical protein [Cryobacterium sp. TMS1-13-1]TFD19240.1 hypothetical protein E3T31_16840 [Cryobacterium sp. TMS1-13-1]